MSEYKTILTEHKAKVIVVADYSASMHINYLENKLKKNDSPMQKVLIKLFPISLKFDDDGELEVYLFQNDFKKMESMNQKNYSTYVNSVIKKSEYSMRGTEYSPVLRDIVNKYVIDENSEANKDKYPVFVLFITDGDSSDESETTSLIKEIAKLNIFIQFIGIGNEKFNYLEKLDYLKDRGYDNVSFEKFSL